jgi:hypothetical protein
LDPTDKVLVDSNPDVGGDTNMRLTSKMDSLGHCPWAAFCPVDLRTELADIAVEASFRAGEYITGNQNIVKGKKVLLPDAGMVLVTKGTVELVTVANGQRVVMEEKSAGFTAGEAELITQHPMEYAVRAKADVSTLAFNQEKLTQLLGSSKVLLEAMWLDIGEGVVLTQLTNQDFFKAWTMNRLYDYVIRWEMQVVRFGNRNNGGGETNEKKGPRDVGFYRGLPEGEPVAKSMFGTPHSVPPRTVGCGAALDPLDPGTAPKERTLGVEITPRAGVSPSTSTAGSSAQLRGRRLSYQICDAITDTSNLVPPFVLVQGQLLVLNAKKEVLRTIEAPRLITSQPNLLDGCSRCRYSAATFNARIMKAPTTTQEDIMIREFTDWSELDRQLHGSGAGGGATSSTTSKDSISQELESRAVQQKEDAKAQGAWEALRDATVTEETPSGSSWDDLSKNLRAAVKAKREAQKMHDRNLKKLNDCYKDAVDSPAGKNTNWGHISTVVASSKFKVGVEEGTEKCVGRQDWFSDCILIAPKEEELEVHQLALSTSEYTHLSKGINPMQAKKDDGSDNYLPKYTDFVLAGWSETLEAASCAADLSPASVESGGSNHEVLGPGGANR